MIKTNLAVKKAPIKLTQSHTIHELNDAQRDELIVSMRKVDEEWVIISRYGDAIWWLTGSPTNITKSNTKVDFTLLPISFQAVAKAILYRYRIRGREGKKPAGAGAMISAFLHMRNFIEYAVNLDVLSLSEISPLLCINYAELCKVTKSQKGQPFSKVFINHRLSTVEMMYELSQYTKDPMPQHPWIDSSAMALSKYGISRRVEDHSITPLLSDEVFTTLFQKAWKIVQSAKPILDLRDRLEAIATPATANNLRYAKSLKWVHLKNLGWKEGAASFNSKILEIRTACYIVIASLSGCRNHEMSYIKKNSYFNTEDNEGEQYWWMRSKSSKTDQGVTEWMIPEAAVAALRIMDQWSAPAQAMLRKQIEAYRKDNPSDLRIAEAQEHLDAIFVGSDLANEMQIRTISLTQTNVLLKTFAQSCGLDWKLASHQFRRKFANYAARSKFGDLRYLREHFKHWSLDMTLSYAMNKSQEMALYLDIENELDDVKRETVAKWLDNDVPLGGGYGKNLAKWRSQEENITLFKSHAHMVQSIAATTAIRSNGHAWCTADDQMCDGSNVNPMRCAGDGENGRGCSSAVIGREHALVYVGLYNNLKTLQDLDDIGEGGRKRVNRDLERCRSVLTTLGHDPLQAVI